jgi:hypothetical protein
LKHREVVRDAHAHRAVSSRRRLRIFPSTIKSRTLVRVSRQLPSPSWAIGSAAKPIADFFVIHAGPTEHARCGNFSPGSLSSQRYGASVSRPARPVRTAATAARDATGLNRQALRRGELNGRLLSGRRSSARDA